MISEFTFLFRMSYRQGYGYETELEFTHLTNGRVSDWGVLNENQ